MRLAPLLEVSGGGQTAVSSSRLGCEGLERSFVPKEGDCRARAGTKEDCGLGAGGILRTESFTKVPHLLPTVQGALLGEGLENPEALVSLPGSGLALTSHQSCDPQGTVSATDQHGSLIAFGFWPRTR